MLPSRDLFVVPPYYEILGACTLSADICSPFSLLCSDLFELLAPSTVTPGSDGKFNHPTSGGGGAARPIKHIKKRGLQGREKGKEWWFLQRQRERGVYL